jgi:outer membrane biosynthesis protein TonB
VVAREDVPVLAPLDSATPFISDRNMRAAAVSAPVAGADPRIGNQEGVALPGLSLFNANASSGAEPAPPPSPPSEAVAETPPSPPPAPSGNERPPESATVQTNDPTAPAAPKKGAEAPALRELPPDPLALSDIKPRSKAPARPPVDPAHPSPRAGKKPVVSSVKTKVEGSLAVRGSDSSVDAKDTPEGRFYSAMHESIGLIWNTRLASVHGLSGTGVVEVEFDIDLSGRVSNVKLVDPGKANPILEDVCLTSVIKAKIPPLPASLKREIQDPLSGGKLHQKINFYKIPRP